MRQLSVAIVGLGRIAGGYDEARRDAGAGIYSHAGAYQGHGGFELGMVLDADGVRAEAFRRTWSARAVATTLEEVCSSFHDVISVCTPDATHAGILREILEAGCCRTVFVEKPLAADLVQVESLSRLAQERGIHLVVNFQRRNEATHRELRHLLASRPGQLLSVTGHYMKGLRHIGVTMVDTLCHLCGYPEAVLTFNRVFNAEVGDHSYEFILYYPGWTVAVKTTDAEHQVYNYHVFEIDLLLSDRRIRIVDNSQGMRESSVTGYAYSGVKVLDDRSATYRETGYKTSMLDAVSYVHDVTQGLTPHVINTPQDSWNSLHIINHIAESLERGSVKLNFEPGLWKR